NGVRVGVGVGVKVAVGKAVAEGIRVAVAEGEIVRVSVGRGVGVIVGRINPLKLFQSMKSKPKDPTKAITPVALKKIHFLGMRKRRIAPRGVMRVGVDSYSSVVWTGLFF